MLAPQSWAEQDAIQADYIANDIVAKGKDFFVVRCAFEVTAPANRWLALDVEFRLSQAIPLIKPNGQMLLKRWNNLFTPVPPAGGEPVAWTDCRLDIDFKNLQEASNLPVGKTFTLWVMGVLFDYASGKHIGSGWAVRTPLVVTTDEEGVVSKVTAPKLSPPQREQVDPASPVRLPVRAGQLDLQHLQPKKDLEAFLSFDQAGRIVVVLQRQVRQAWEAKDYGPMFQPIDSADKARELAMAAHQGDWLIPNREVHVALEEKLKAQGWASGDIPAQPTVFGVIVTPAEPIGWRVQLTVVESTGLNQQAQAIPGDVVFYDHLISADGWIGTTATTCILSPTRHKAIAGSIAQYAQSVREVLAEVTQPVVIKPIISPVGPFVRIPVPEKSYLAAHRLPKDWPGWAKPKSPATKSSEPDKPTTQPAADPQPTPQPASSPSATTEPTTRPVPTTQPADAK
jgi:hypothetical protein